MKKYFLTIILVTLIIPQIAFAAWWNPFSWKVFNREESKTQVLENRVKELEKKLEANVSTSTKVEKTIKQPEVKEKKKITPVDNSALLEAKKQAQLEQEALLAKQKAEEQARAEDLLIKQRVEEQAKIRVELEKQDIQNAKIIAEQKAAQEYLTQQLKQEKLDAINRQIIDLNAKYLIDLEIARNSGATVSFAEGSQQRVTNQYNLDYAKLIVEFQKVQYGN